MKTKIIGFRVPDAYEYTGGQYKDTIELLFPIFWAFIPADQQARLMEEHPKAFKVLDIGLPDKKEDL